MGLSQDKLRTVGDWSPHACTVRSEGDSQYQCFSAMSVMRVPSDLYSLLRNGGWIRNSFASVNVRKPWAAVGLLLNRCLRVREQSISAEVSSVDVIKKKAASTGWDSGPSDLREHIVGSLKVRWFGERERSVPSETTSVGMNSKNPTTTTWDSLPNDFQANVLQRVDFKDLFHLKTVSNSWKKFIEVETFRQSWGGISEGVFTAVNNSIKIKSWRRSGHDLHSKSWRSLPRVSCLPPPDAELFKEYSVCDHGGVMCAEVSKLPNKGELVVFNPLTGESQALPPLLHPRNPKLVHISVDSTKGFFKVIAAGSSAASDEHLSRKVEVFDSSTSKWKEVCDLPGPAFGLNEHQAGVCLNGKLFFISFLEGEGRGVVALDVENGTWLQDLTTPIPWSSYSSNFQLVESDGKLFLFSEQQRDHSVDLCIDELEFQNPKGGVLTCRWRSFVKVKKSGGRGLQVYAEHSCVGVGEEKLSICNPRRKKLLHYLFASCIAIMPHGACAGDHSMDSRSGVWKVPISNAWESPDFAKKAAVTLLVGLTMIGGRFAWEIFRRRRAPGNGFDIRGGLEDSDIPTKEDPKFEILAAIPA